MEENFTYLEKQLQEEENLKKFSPITLTELQNKQFSDPRWVVDKLVPEGGITIFAGAPSSCKTWVILELALKVSKGLPLFNHFSTTQANVLYIDEEMTERRLKQRFTLLSGKESNDVHILSFSQFTLKPDPVETLLKYCEEHNIKVVIFDSYVRIANIKDENNAVDVKNSFEQLKPIIAKGIAVIMTHHNRKTGTEGRVGEAMRGSSDILASIDSLISLKSEGVERKLITFNHAKSRHIEQMKDFDIEMSTDPETKAISFKYSGDAINEFLVKQKSIEDAIIETISETKGTPKTQSDLVTIISEKTECGRNKIMDTLKKLVTNKSIAYTKGTGNRYYYSLVEISNTFEEMF